MFWKPHTTVAAIIERDNQFLMVEETVENQLVYNQPAGHLDPDESLLDAVIRETREETAWLFKPTALVGVYLWKKQGQSDETDPDASFLRFTFCGECSDFKEDQALDDGIERALWLSRAQLAERSEQLRSPLVLKNIDDYIAGKRYPLDLTQFVK